MASVSSGIAPAIPFNSSFILAFKLGIEFFINHSFSPSLFLNLGSQLSFFAHPFHGLNNDIRYGLSFSLLLVLSSRLILNLNLIPFHSLFSRHFCGCIFFKKLQKLFRLEKEHLALVSSDNILFDKSLYTIQAFFIRRTTTTFSYPAARHFWTFFNS